MTHHRLGNRDESLKWYEKSKSKWLDFERSLPWFYRLEMQLLKREAEELLGVELESTAID